MKEPRVAILGGTGAVGREMMKILEERNFPLSELRILASARSAGSTVEFRGEKLTVRETNDEAFKGCDIVLGAATVILAMGEGRRAAAGINEFLKK